MEDYFYPLCAILLSGFDILLYDGVLKTNRSPELDAELRSKRYACNSMRYRCCKAYDNFINEYDLIKAQLKLRDLMYLL
jgi:hypothetical protein